MMWIPTWMEERHGRWGRTLAVVGVMGALVAADGGLVHAQLLVLVALPHRAPEARIMRPQLQRAHTHRQGVWMWILRLTTGLRHLISPRWLWRRCAASLFASAVTLATRIVLVMMGPSCTATIAFM